MRKIIKGKTPRAETTNEKEKKETDTIFAKIKKWYKMNAEPILVEFDEPVLIQMRNDRNCIFKEGITAGHYPFIHSDGGQRFHILSAGGLTNIRMGKDSFRAYLCHEDHPLPLTQMMRPVASTEVVAQWDEKRTQELAALKRGDQSKKEWFVLIAKWILFIVAGTVGIFVVANILASIFNFSIPQLGINVDTAVQATQQVVNNVTQAVNNTPSSLGNVKIVG